MYLETYLIVFASYVVDVIRNDEYAYNFQLQKTNNKMQINSFAIQ